VRVSVGACECVCVCVRESVCESVFECGCVCESVFECECVCVYLYLSSVYVHTTAAVKKTAAIVM